VKVVFAPSAKLDLRDIAAWISRDNPGRAATFVEDIVDRCHTLADMPRRYPLVPRYEQHGIRRMPFGEYLVFYRVTDDAVQIVHVLHGARDYEKLLFPAGEGDGP
jgi:toxin ParE1/3/4